MKCCIIDNKELLLEEKIRFLIENLKNDQEFMDHYNGDCVRDSLTPTHILLPNRTRHKAIGLNCCQRTQNVHCLLPISDGFSLPAQQRVLWTSKWDGILNSLCYYRGD